MEITKRNAGYFFIILSIFLLGILIFVRLNFDSEAVFLCEAVAANPVLTMEDCPAHTSSTPWLLTLAFVIAAAIFFVGVYFLLPEKTTTVKHFQKADLSAFDSDEKKVYDLLKEKGGSAYQSDIVKALEMSKVKVTRVLDSLEHTHLAIERKRRGMTNIVVLK
ncbi:hypothetical protein COV20_05650 [Candidatus Woesearchaeota archaeon CG10_big_fil_rev_8_21_14_0_10_45_16]|nr:MAG: hypothetical protein COV20_05650 [Candidatus Woesearchaeota archaeon CG10_big_fil_rev_8_21_14_0_10_45_16]